VQKAKGNHHKMSKTLEGCPDVKNNPKKLSVLRRMGLAAVEAAKRILGRGSGEQAKDTSGEAPVKSDDVITTPEYPVYPKPSFPEFVTTPDGNRPPVESSNTPAALIEPSKPTSRDIHGDERRGFVGGAAAKYLNSVKPSTPEEQASNSTEDASGSSAEKNIPVSEPPEPTPAELDIIKQNDEAMAAAAKDSSSVKPSTPEKPVDVSENEPKYYSLDDLIYNKDIPKSKADEILKNAYGTAHEPKTLDELIDNPNISKEEADEILDRVYGSSSEKNDREDDVNSAKSDQESGAAESSKDEQVKDSNSDTGEAPVKEISPEEHELATNLKVARMRYVKASVKYETRFFKENFGGEERRKKLDAAAEELKRCELEYMRFQFSEKIEAVKQGSEEDQAKLAEEMAHAVFEDMQRVSREIKEAYSEKLDSQSPIRKVLSKLGKWINKGGKISQTVKQGGAGLVGGAIVGSVATWPITTAVGLAAGVGVANLAKLGVLEDRRDKDVLSEIPIERLRKLFRDDVKGMDVGDVIDHTVGESIGELHNASVERQGYLRKRMRWAMGRFGIGFALGGYAGKFIGDWANSAHATGDSASQSGGKELKTHLFEKVKNTAPGAADPVGNYTPGLDSLYGYDPSKHEFLWQWAESVYGEGNGTSGIMHTVDVLRDNGYIVDIINNPNGSFSVVVDGVSDTEGLVKIFSQFVN
jgi:hypothetical protein